MGFLHISVGFLGTSKDASLAWLATKGTNLSCKLEKRIAYVSLFFLSKRSGKGVDYHILLAGDYMIVMDSIELVRHAAHNNRISKGCAQ